MPTLVIMLVINQMDRTNVGFVQDDLKADITAGAYFIRRAGSGRGGAEAAAPAPVRTASG
ncbi:hypothetical protein JBE27_09505 [Streptomyces albiflaviniger]|nr:hypothetical protein [Streptomyces albiflaviniger]